MFFRFLSISHNQSAVKILKDLNSISRTWIVTSTVQRTSSTSGKDPPDSPEPGSKQEPQCFNPHLAPVKSSNNTKKSNDGNIINLRVEDIGKKMTMTQDLIFPTSVYDKRTLKIDQYGLPLLTPKDCLRRFEFAVKTLDQIEKNKDILPSLVFSDEGNFKVFKSPSSSYKGTGRRNESKNLPVIVWCGMTSRDVVGPYFFNSYVTELGYPVEQTWFQQDGAPPHRSKRVLKFLRQRFGPRLISYGSTNIWPSKSQDLTPLDYFLWNHLKEKITTSYRPTTVEDMKECISLELDQIDSDLLEMVIFDFRNRLQSCINARGDRFESRQNFS